MKTYYAKTPGGLLDVLNKTDPREIVPDFSDYVTLTADHEFTSGNFTYYGNEAPGLGVCFRGATPVFKNMSNFRLHYFRSRPGGTIANQGRDGIRLENCSNVILSNGSFTHTPDECIDIINSTDVTIHQCIIGPALHLYSTTPDVPTSRGLDVRTGSNRITQTSNLFFSNEIRNPKFAITDDIDFEGEVIGNVIYNCGEGLLTGLSSSFDRYFHVDIMRNIFLAGPLTGADKRGIYATGNTPQQAYAVHLDDNRSPDRTSSEDPESDVIRADDLSKFSPVAERWHAANGVPLLSADSVLADVLANVGLVGMHDDVEVQILADVVAGDAPIAYPTEAVYPSLP